jgi:hypothetical protein
MTSLGQDMLRVRSATLPTLQEKDAHFTYQHTKFDSEAEFLQFGKRLDEDADFNQLEVSS